MAYHKYHDDINSWGGSGNNPNIGTDSNPSETPSNGYNNSSPESTALNVPQTDDYTGWNWEQILNGVLGLSLPSRQEVTNLRWTVTDNNMNDDHSLFKIFGAAWDQMLDSDSKDFLVYLNPGLQTTGGPWDEYYNTPANQLSAALSGPGGNWSGVAVDPKDFATIAVALGGVQGFYLNASDAFDNITSGLKSEAGQYKGAAGETFYNLMSNLNIASQSIYTQMVPSSGSSYSGMVGQSGTDTWNFVVGLWNALVGWINTRLDYSPLGAIFQALLDGGVVQNNGNGNYSVPQSLDALTNNPSFGNLLSDGGWLQVESAAKELWSEAINSSLDQVAQPLVIMLADSYLNTASLTKPLNPPTLNQIGAGNVGDNIGDNVGDDFNSLANSMDNGFNGLGDGLGDLGSGLGNIGAGLGDGFNGLGNGLGDLDTGLGSGLNGLGNGLDDLGSGLGSGFNGLSNGLGDLGSGLGSGFNGLSNGLGDLDTGLGNGLNSPGGVDGLNTPSELAASLNTPGGLTDGLNTPGGLADGLNTPGGLADGLNTPGGLTSALGTNPNALSDSLGNPGSTSGLQSALGDSQAEQKALQNALALAPSSGPLHNALEAALADNGQEQNALQSALAGNTPAGTALQNALGDNNEVQSALNGALSSGQVPSTGPLRTSLQQALGDNTKTRHALQHALSASVPGGTSLEHALTSNGKLQSTLRHALSSGQVPQTGPLHNSLESALADSGKAKTALDQALAGNGSPTSIQHAIADNKAAQTELQKALSSGEVPKTGPLHNELESALADTRGVGNALHQALTSAGVPAEAGKLITSPAVPDAALGNLGKLLGGGNGLMVNLGHQPALSTGVGGVGGGPAGLGGAAGLSAGAGAGLAGGTGAPVSSGRFVAPAAQSAGEGTSAVPFSTPMMGGGMGMGGGQQQGLQERERTTWLAEDEDVWGTEPSVGPGVLGRDFMGADEDPDDYDEYSESAEAQRRSPSRAQAR
jgi:hypothetical protein